jgi:hypothetical protein
MNVAKNSEVIRKGDHALRKAHDLSTLRESVSATFGPAGTTLT